MIKFNGNKLFTNIGLKIISNHVVHAKNEIGTKIVGDKSIDSGSLSSKLYM